MVRTDLQSLLLRRQRVDDPDPPGFGGQQPHLVAFVRPPGLADVTGPVGARAGGGHVHEAAPGRVVPHAVGQGVYVFLDLRTEDRCTQVNAGPESCSLIGWFAGQALTSLVSGSNQLLMSFPADSMMGSRRASPAGRHGKLTGGIYPHFI